MNRFRTLKRLAIFLLVLMIAGGIFSYAIAEEPPTAASLIVKMVSGLSTEEQATVIAANGGTETSSIPALRLHIVEVPASELSTIIQNYQNDSRVVRVEENKERKAEGEPSDTDYLSQWALPKIGWDQVFGTITPAGSATVAVLDTGVDSSHDELAGKLITCASILSGSDCTSDPHGHGTWLAGIVAANTDNNNGIAGVGYAGVQIMPVTVMNAEGIGQDSDIIAGVIWAADNGADVILMGFSNPGFSQNLQDAIDYAWENNVVLVAATGNDGISDPTFPAGDRGVIGVSATDQSDNFVSFSNYGQDVFLAAPGLDIETTDTSNSFISISGTSSSAAIVAGAAAFMRAVEPGLSNGIIVGRLARNADPAGDPVNDPDVQLKFGNGRVNMARALEDTSLEEVQPAGAEPVGDGGPYIGPYKIAANGTVTGTVKDNVTTLPISGANVTVSCPTCNSNSQTVSATTNSSGIYSASINWSSGSRSGTVSVTATGYSNGGPSNWGPISNNGTATVDFNLTPSCTAPSISVQPAGATKTVGDSVIFSVTASGDTPLSYQWKKDGVDISGATSSSYTINSVVVANAGSYTVYISNACDSETSSAATLTVNKATPTATLAVSNSPQTYSGSPQAATVNISASSVPGSVANILTGGAATQTNANTYAVTADFVPNDTTNYNTLTSLSAGNFTINKAPVTATAGSGSGTYNGSTQSPSACAVTGVYKGDLTCANNPASVGPDVGTTVIEPVVSGTGLTNFDVTKGNGSYTINKAPLTVTADPQSVQYSDPVDFTFQYSGFVGSDDADVIDTAPTCGVSVPHDAPDTYTITCSGGEDNNYDFSYVDGTLTVTQEDAEVSYDLGNPTSVPVVVPGGNSGPFTIDVEVQELLPDAGCPGDPDDCPGDISHATVSIKLSPVGPGGDVGGNCTPGSVIGTGYNAKLPVSCVFTNVPVNTYSVVVDVGGYYTGTYEDVLTVYDPSLGFTTGGGWFYWPGTTDRTNFGYTMKYNKNRTNLQGSLLVIRHLADGSMYRIKSNSLGALSLGTNALSMPYGWASFTGKATYLQPGWTNAVGNYSFTVYVEDNNEPGTGNDKFWIEVKNPSNTKVDDLSMSKTPTAAANAQTLLGGNIVVPHTRGK